MFEPVSTLLAAADADCIPSSIDVSGGARGWYEKSIRVHDLWFGLRNGGNFGTNDVTDFGMIWHI